MKSYRGAFLNSIAILASLGALTACHGTSNLPAVAGANAASTSSGIRSDGENDYCADYKLKLDNQSGIANDKVFFLLAGRAGDLASSPFIYLVNDKGKTEVAKAGTDVKTFSLAEMSEFVIPVMRAARFYVSYDKELKLPVRDVGTLPSIIYPDAANKNDTTAWDFLEWNKYSDCPKDKFNQVNFAPNLSQVDAFTIPMQFHIEGTNDKGEPDVEATRGFASGAYSKALQEIQSNPAFAGLYLNNGSGRILSTIKGYDAGVISHTYYDPYINDVWKKYATAKLQMTYDLTCKGLSERVNGLQGEVKNNQLVFTQTSPPSGCTLDPIAFKMPSTRDVFFGLIQLDCVSGCKGGGGAQENTVSQIGAALNAAFYRSTLLKTNVISNASAPYVMDQDRAYCEQKDAAFYDAHITNFYGKAVHAQALDHLAYLSSVDEVCGQSSLVHYNIPGLKFPFEKNATKFTVTLVKR